MYYKICIFYKDRDLEDTLRYLAIIFGILLGVALIACIFLCCFCVGKTRQRSKRSKRYNLVAVLTFFLNFIFQIKIEALLIDLHDR